MLYDGRDGDIIQQYVIFTKIYREQVKLYGRTQRAVLETIRICKDQNILKAYLEKREKEVVDIMMTLFNREQILEAYVEEEKRMAAREAAKEATQNTGKAAAINLHNMGMDVAFIAKAINQSDEVVKSWLGL